MLWNPQQQLHIHPIWITTNDELRHVQMTNHILKQVHLNNDYHTNQWSDKTINDKQGRQKILQIAGVSSIEEIHLSEDRGKWLVVTSRACRTQVQNRSWSYDEKNDPKGYVSRVQQPSW